MTIHLPEDLESSIQAAVHSGRYASVDGAITEAVSLLLHLPNAPAESRSPSRNWNRSWWNLVSWPAYRRPATPLRLPGISIL